MFLYSLLAELKWYPILFDSPANVVRSAAFWLTVVLTATFVIGLFLTKNRARFLKTSLTVAIVYSCALIIVLLSFALKEDGIQPLLFYPLAVLCALILLSILAYALVSKKAPEKKKLVGIAATVLVAAAFIVALALISAYYRQNIKADGYYNSDTASVNQIVLYIGAIALTAVIIALAIFGNTSAKKGFDAKSLAYAGVCVAMSFALSYLRIVKLPQGGSVTIASLLPLMLYAYLFGTKKGVIVGFAYGLLQAVQDPWIIHPAQFLLDYPVAFAAIGLSGLFSKIKALNKLPQIKFALGAIVGSVMRFICHVLSGVFAFSAYAGNQNPWAYSLAYNSFVFVDIALAILVGVLVFSSKSFLKVTGTVGAGAATKTETAKTNGN
ncbi:MAG: energy-coupled thiamine transporter ThiT [Clostridia bacterium]|nr:energy-coupled thiamine transporter ThiT [Clostridia bacterium]